MAWSLEGQLNVDYNVFITGCCLWWEHRNVCKLGEVITFDVEDHPLAVIGLDVGSEVAVVVQPGRGDQLVVDDGAGARRRVLMKVSVGLKL